MEQPSRITAPREREKSAASEHRRLQRESLYGPEPSLKKDFKNPSLASKERDFKDSSLSSTERGSFYSDVIRIRSERRRRDTDESCISNLALQRSNTGWSAAGSTATDLTNFDSTDAPCADDSEGVDSGAETSATPPRRSSLFPRSLASRRRLTIIRGPPSTLDDRSPSSLPDELAPGHRRVEQVGLRKSNLGRFTVPDAEYGPSPSCREPSPAAVAKSWDTESRGHKTDHDSADTRPCPSQGDGHGQDGNVSALRAGGISPPSSLQPVEDAAQSSVVSGDELDADVDNAPTSREEGAEASGGTNTPQERRVSCCSTGMSDSCDEGFWRRASGPDDSMIYQVCDLVLQQAFAIPLHEIVLAGSAPMVYESVGHCLDELSRIVLQSGLGDTHLGASRSTLGTADSGGDPVWPGRGADDGFDTSNGNGDCHANGNSGRKRSNGYEHDGDGLGGGSGGGSPDGGGKRQKVLPTHQRPATAEFSCPFRKRNPVRFNVRDFQSCAVMSFPNMSQLKRHVKTSHNQRELWPFTCQRCRRAMKSKMALEEHISVSRDQICDPQEAPSRADPEDGITSGIEEVLNERKTDGKIDDWKSLWRLLFPGDAKIPEPDFVPPTELDEVYAQFYTDDSTSLLWQRIQEVLGHTGNIQPMFDAFKNYIDTVFEACRLKTCGMSYSRRRARIQAARQVASGRSPVRHAPRPHGSGHSDHSILALAASSDRTNVPESLGQPSMTETQPHILGNVPPNNSSHDRGIDGAGTTVPELRFGGGGTAAVQGSEPVMVATPAPRLHIQLESGCQGQRMAGTSRGHLDQSTRLAQTNLWADLSAIFAGRGAIDASAVLPLGSQGAHSHPEAYGQQMGDAYWPAITLDIAADNHGGQGRRFSTTDAGAVSEGDDAFQGMSEANDDGYEVVHHTRGD